MDKLRQLLGKLKGPLLFLDHFTEQLYSLKSRPRIHRLFVLALCLASSYSLGKFSALILQMETGRPAPVERSGNELALLAKLHQNTPNISRDIQIITSRDLFNTKQQTETANHGRQKRGPCLSSSTRSNSGVSLISAIVLQNEHKSVAALKVKSKRDVLSLWQGDPIPSVGKVGKIEHSRVIFRNDKTGQCEFAEIKKRSGELRSKISVLPVEQGKKLLDRMQNEKSVSQKGNNFTIKRSYLNQGLENLADIISDVNAIKIKNPDGTLSFQINGVEPGGLFAKLGIENEDRIQSIDGRPIRNQNQIFALFNNLKTAKNMSITVLRDGTKQKLKYTFAD